MGSDNRPEHRTHGWRTRLATVPTAEVAFERWLARLRELIVHCPELRRPVHGDLLYRNVLVAGDRFSGIFDWGCAMWGDPLYDMALIDFASAWHPDFAAVDFRAETRARFPAAVDLDARFSCYQLHVGLGAIAYNAFIGDRVELANCVQRTNEVGARTD